jgi:hypothetical protein
MFSNSRIFLTTILLLALTIIGPQLLRAQSPDPRDQQIQQLKDKLQQLEQMMNDVRSEINALEKKSAQPEATATPAEVAPPSVVAPTPAVAAATPAGGKKSESKGTFNIYGFVMVDSGYNGVQQDPNWFDVLRPTKLPAYNDQFGPGGNVFFSVRQTRFGVKTSSPTPLGDLKTWFEFELFGTGVDAGQTTFRLRQAYGELGHFGAGQTWSPFMDIDVFPNSLEYWGPNGMVFFRNVQLRWMPIQGSSNVAIALERPGASADGGIYSDRVELSGIKPKFDLPDLSGHARIARSWGYVQGAGMLRKIGWTDNNRTATQDLSRNVLGWGVNGTSNLNFGKNDVGKFEVVYGRGIENYMNDAPIDIAIQTYPGNLVTPAKGIPLPVLGVVAFLDHNWSKKVTTATGYSMVNIWNANGETPSDFHQGYYALTNLLFNPVPSFTFGGEFQYGRRVNFNDGFNVNDYRAQFSFKYNYGKVLTY